MSAHDRVPPAARVPKGKEEQRFGFVAGAGLVALAILAGWRGFGAAALGLAGTGMLLALLGLVAPQSLRGPRRAWLRLGGTLGAVSTYLVLAVVFFGLVTPMGIAMRLAGYDPLRRRGRGPATYWVPYPARQRDPRHYEKMY